MNEFNILTTYYNNKSLLLKFVDGYLHHKKQYPFLKLIIVDDGSMIYPAVDFLVKEDIPDCSLYRVPIDLGFNSHGCRNLAMTVSDKHLNLLLDSDVELKKYPLEYLVDTFIDEHSIIRIKCNSMLINKDQFFSCNGYDEEFINFHYGDRIFHKYLERKYIVKYWDRTNKTIMHNRNSRENIFTNRVKITTYDDVQGILYSPIIENIGDIIKFVDKRYKSEDFSSKKILTFPWEKVW